MKITYPIVLVLCLVFSTHNTNAQQTQQQDSLGLPGDNLNLYAVMKLFQNSETLEGFERSLNAEDTRVNNLDLNNDDQTDYIKVINQVENEVHTIVLQVPINENENQDVATFIIEKNKDGEVHIQLIGDEDLYGKDYIIEPSFNSTAKNTETPNPGYIKQSSTNLVDKQGNTTIINNYYKNQPKNWPVVRYMYVPTYSVWISPWGWYHYPIYWKPWRPWFWHRYYGYHFNHRVFYFSNYKYCNNYRNPVIYKNYYHRRTNSVTLTINIRSGNFRKAYTQPASRAIGKKDFIYDAYKARRNKIETRSKINLTPIKKDAIRKNLQDMPAKKEFRRDEIKTNGKNRSTIEKPSQTDPKKNHRPERHRDIGRRN